MSKIICDQMSSPWIRVKKKKQYKKFCWWPLNQYKQLLSHETNSCFWLRNSCITKFYINYILRSTMTVKWILSGTLASKSKFWTQLNSRKILNILFIQPELLMLFGSTICIKYIKIHIKKLVFWVAKDKILSYKIWWMYDACYKR